MKFKRIVLVTLILSILLLSACGAKVEKENEKSREETSMFIEVERCYTWMVVYHKDTKVMYAVSNSSYNYGIFTPLVNQDGSPMLWEGN